MSSAHPNEVDPPAALHHGVPLKSTERSLNTQHGGKDEVVRDHATSQSPSTNNAITSVQDIRITYDTQHESDVVNGDPTQSLRPDYSDIFTPAPPLASSRYNRQLLIPSISLTGHGRIARSKILIIGLGGLGSPAALYLAGAGVGTLGLMDDDKVELSNLHRQIVHCEASVRDGLGKVESAVRACRALNGEIEVVGHEMRCDVSIPGQGEKLFQVVKGYDLVLDCTDNPATRYLISDVCVLLGKVLVSGAAQRLEGQLCLLNYPTSQAPEAEDRQANGEERPTQTRGPCYRCVFPTPPSPEMVKGCGEIGILGPVVGTIGTLMASEALRCVAKGAEPGRKPTMLLYNAWSVDPRGMFRSIALRGRRKDCVACGDYEALKEKGTKRITKEEVSEGHWNYVRFCGLVEDVKVLRSNERISARDFLDRSGNASATLESKQHLDWNESIVIDTREPHEIELGPKIGGSVNVPLSKILRRDGTVAEMNNLLHDGKKNAMVFVCQKGNDSQIAAKRLLDFRSDKLAGEEILGTQKSQSVFIGDIAGGFAAIEKALT